jgi:Cdc6-like AAA superfamily ATPase
MTTPEPLPANASPIDREQRLALLARTFTPAIPVGQSSVFAGRLEQLQQVIDAIAQPGVHVVIFGEPGVGKTSMANILSSRLDSRKMPVVAPRVTCERTDDFSSLWRRIFDDIKVTRDRSLIGFGSSPRPEQSAVSESLPDALASADVKQALTSVGKGCVLVVIIDEFDRLGDADVRASFADTIKVLSDHAVPATLVLVGVADTVEQLIEQHQSVERALVQVRMPRMSEAELAHIVTQGLELLGMTIPDDALSVISSLSQGLPHYTHLLALHATRLAIDAGSESVEIAHVLGAIGKALDKAQHSIRSAYHRATASRKAHNRYSDVLLACALAQTDAFGYFGQADVRLSLDRLRGGERDARFDRHLKHFAEPGEESVLQATEMGHGRRYRFRNPLMQPYIILQGVAEGRITAKEL